MNLFNLVSSCLKFLILVLLSFSSKVSLGCVTPFAVVNESARYCLPEHWFICVFPSKFLIISVD